jgi:hypothetical protein
MARQHFKKLQLRLFLGAPSRRLLCWWSDVEWSGAAATGVRLPPNKHMQLTGWIGRL